MGEHDVHDTEAEVSFEVEVRFPRSLAPAMAEALTGNDDDIVLAAERAMRERIGNESANVELSPPVGLDEYLNELADVERRSVAIYGPAREAS